MAKNDFELKIFKAEINTKLDISYIGEGISAGFPSPAQDFIENSIDLNEELIKHPQATFYGRVKGNSLQDLGIHNGDLLIIDKSIEPKSNMIAVCYIDGEFTVKIIKIEKECCWLMPANSEYKPIKVMPENDFMIWGIVIHVIKSFNYVRVG